MNALDLELVLAKIERLTRHDGKRSAATLDEIGALAREAVGQAAAARIAEGRTRERLEVLAKRMAASMGLSEEAALAAARDWEVHSVSYSAVEMRREMRRWEEFYARRRERSEAGDAPWIDPVSEAEEAAQRIDARPLRLSVGYFRGLGEIRGAGTLARIDPSQPLRMHVGEVEVRDTSGGPPVTIRATGEIPAGATISMGASEGAGPLYARFAGPDQEALNDRFRIDPVEQDGRLVSIQATDRNESPRATGASPSPLLLRARGVPVVRDTGGGRP